MSRNQATSQWVDHDLVFRWSAESLVAIGVEVEQALVISQAVIRSCELLDSAGPVASLVAELERVPEGSFSIIPNHELTVHSESSISVRV